METILNPPRIRPEIYFAVFYRTAVADIWFPLHGERCGEIHLYTSTEAATAEMQRAADILGATRVRVLELHVLGVESLPRLENKKG